MLHAKEHMTGLFVDSSKIDRGVVPLMIEPVRNDDLGKAYHFVDFCRLA
uniref:Uncharacterized protein n=1 Tax=Arundo donax TaxID=35708 RepID=A0A0A9BNQ0_ARUDO